MTKQRKFGISAARARRLYPRGSLLDRAAWKARLEVIEELTERVLKRDGPKCWYCGHITTTETRTLEHILAQASGGTDDLANLCIACEDCNGAVADRSVVDKIAYRDSLRDPTILSGLRTQYEARIAQIDAAYQSEPRPPRPLSPGAAAQLEMVRLKNERSILHSERQSRDDRRFVEAARAELPQETYLGIWRRATEGA